MTEAKGRPSLLARLHESIDARGLATFRVLFGLLGTISALRFIAYGWVDELFVKPTFFFHYWGASWVRPLPAAAMHALFPALALLGLCISAGFLYRLAIVLFTLGWTYVQLCDLTNYLNHYYFVTWLGLLMCLLPLHASTSVDAWLRPTLRRSRLPRWMLWLLRFQVGVVYTYAGVAKLTSDWLLHAQPLDIWLSSRTGLPWLGPWLAHPSAPLAMSWAGCLFDLSIVSLLLHRRTRPWAYGAVLAFHTLTRTLFPIGMFSAIMVTAATVFFDPDWPADLWTRLRRWATRAPTHRALVSGGTPDVAPAEPSEAPSGWSVRAGVAAFGVYACFQLLMPLRNHLYGGNVLWHEQGMRFSWRVMVREKNASVRYRVEDPRSHREVEVAPERFLTTRQLREFGTQPDMILQLAHHIADEFQEREGQRPRVRVDAQVSLNGRPIAPLIDPEQDLAAIEDGLAPAGWILPSPATSPPNLKPIAWTERHPLPTL